MYLHIKHWQNGMLCWKLSSSSWSSQCIVRRDEMYIFGLLDAILLTSLYNIISVSFLEHILKSRISPSALGFKLSSSLGTVPQTGLKSWTMNSPPHRTDQINNSAGHGEIVQHCLREEREQIQRKNNAHRMYVYVCVCLCVIQGCVSSKVNWSGCRLHTAEQLADGCMWSKWMLMPCLCQTDFLQHAARGLCFLWRERNQSSSEALGELHQTHTLIRSTQLCTHTVMPWFI